MTDRTPRISRRGLLKTASVAGLGLSMGRLAAAREDASPPAIAAEKETAARSVIGLRFAPRDIVRLGIVGCGLRGQSLLREFFGIAGVSVRALCDVVADRVTESQALLAEAGHPEAAGYVAGDHDFENLVRRDDLDLVLIATPWNWHVPMAVAALDAGKHAAVEVPAATTVEGCWALVGASERNQRHCMMVENCCYGWAEMLVLNMVRAGLFGELLHAEAAYNHDLREILFETRSEGLWRRAEHLGRNGNLYPTHGLGPVARYLDINRGDRFARLVSMSSPEAGLTEWRRRNVPAGDPRWQERYRCGDVNTSLIQTARGRTITLQHTVAAPHPYDRINLISGTKGIFRGYPDRLYLEGQPGPEQYTSLDAQQERFEDPLWKRLKEQAKAGGHGGMDTVMCWRLVQCLREGLAPDMDVYDAAALSVPGPLSEQSVAGGGAPVEFPDFTRGRWSAARGGARGGARG